MPTTHILARAVIRNAGQVLVVRAEGQPHTFLPGGHREPGEGLAGCVRRELREELGVEADVGSYLGGVEHRWHRDDTRQYEINHCFEVEVPSLDAGTMPSAQEKHLSFRWAAVGSLDEVALKPSPLRALLATRTHPTTPWWASTLE